MKEKQKKKEQKNQKTESSAKNRQEKKKSGGKKLLLIFGLILMVGALAFAGKSLGFWGVSGSEGVADAYLKAVQKFDLKVLQELMDPEGQKEVQEALDLTAGEGSIGATIGEFVKERNKESMYTVLSIKEDGDTAIVTADCSYVEWNTAYAKINEMVLGLAVDQLLSGKEITGDQIKTLVAQVLNPETMTIEEPKAPEAAKSSENEGESTDSKDEKLTKEEKEKLKEEDKKKAEEAKVLEEKLAAEKKKLEEELAVKVEKLKKELEFPLKQSTLQIHLVQIDGKWHVSHVEEGTLDSSWVGLKTLIDGIMDSMEMMGIEPPQEPTPES